MYVFQLVCIQLAWLYFKGWDNGQEFKSALSSLIKEQGMILLTSYIAAW